MLQESFTCRQHKEEPEVANIDLSVHRDVSLIEPGSDGRPHQQKTGRTVKPLGQRGDVIDYGKKVRKLDFAGLMFDAYKVVALPKVFENVESYACNEDMTDDKKTIRAIQMRTPGLEREPEGTSTLFPEWFIVWLHCSKRTDVCQLTIFF